MQKGIGALGKAPRMECLLKWTWSLTKRKTCY